MFDDVINKQAFEFTCRTEKTAGEIQHHIESHTAIQFSNIINEVFSSTNRGNTYLQVDKIEIDLGDLWADELDSFETASRFRELFRQKIENIQWLQTNTEQNMAGKNESTFPIPEIAIELELIRSFITSGDLPWWANKNEDLRIDTIVRNLLSKDPLGFKKLLLDINPGWGQLSRLFAHIGPAAFPLVSGTTPEFSFGELKQLLIKQFLQVSTNKDASEQSEELERILTQFEHTGQTLFEKKRGILLKSLLVVHDLLFVKKLNIESAALQQLLVQFGVKELFSPGETWESKMPAGWKQHLKDSIKQLSLPEMEMLLFELSLVFKEVNNSPYSESIRGEREATGINSNLNNKKEFQRTGAKEENYVDEKVDNAIAPTSRPVQPGFSAGLHRETASMVTKNQGPQYPTKSTITTINAASQPVITNPVNDGSEIAGLSHSRLWMNAGNSVVGAAKTECSNDYAKSPSSVTPGKLVTDQFSPHRLSYLNFILRTLNRSDKVVVDYLNQLGDAELKTLKTIFKEYSSEISNHKKNIGHVLEHPFFMMHNILQIYAGIVYAQSSAHISKGSPPEDSLNKPQLNKKALNPATVSGGKSVSPRLFSLFEQLPAKDFLVVTGVFSKRSIDTAAEKSIFKKVLQQLPEKDILLLKYLAALPPTELQKLQQLPDQTSVLVGDKTHTIEENSPTQNEHTYIQIENAGLCLLAAYLPGFFRQVGYLENNKFKNKSFATRATYLLQYIVTGTSKRPEYLLQFNKILCSYNPAELIINNIRLTKKEKNEADNLLVSVIQNWKALKKTSVAGFRASFLQRKGILSETSTEWVLRVEKKGYDILLDAVPWNFNLVKLSWIKKPIRVEW